MPSALVRSLAKINLDLRVLHRRPDGFHELRTVFQTVSLSDTIYAEFTAARSSSIHVESAVEIPDNLIFKAADLLLAAMGMRARVQFRLEKRIPMGGGLGGGSSNAAAVLLALPALAGKQVPLEKLLELGAQLGSDVPFFLLGGTAVGLGRGTEVYPLPDAPVRPAVLVCPGVHVSTAGAYAGLQRELTPEVPLRNIDTFQSFAWRVGDGGPVSGWDVVNDFESVVLSQYPQLKSIKGKLLKLGARPALMSGSGSTIFGIFESRLEQDRAVVSLSEELGRDKIHPVSLVNRKQYRSLWRRQLRAEVEGDVWPPQERFVK